MHISKIIGYINNHMATIVNNPPAQPAQPVQQSSGSDGSNWALMIVFFIIFLILIVYFGLPLLRRATAIPQAPQVNVPGKIDVNVNTPQK